MIRRRVVRVVVVVALPAGKTLEQKLEREERAPLMK
jgi:hypothetical protein